LNIEHRFLDLAFQEGDQPKSASNWIIATKTKRYQNKKALNQLLIQCLNIFISQVTKPAKGKSNLN